MTNQIRQMGTKQGGVSSCGIEQMCINNPEDEIPLLRFSKAFPIPRFSYS